MMCFIILILMFSSALMVVLVLQISKIVLVLLAGLFVSSCSIFGSPVGSLCHTRGVVRRPSSVVRRVSSVSTITTRNN